MTVETDIGAGKWYGYYNDWMRQSKEFEIAEGGATEKSPDLRHISNVLEDWGHTGDDKERIMARLANEIAIRGPSAACATGSDGGKGPAIHVEIYDARTFNRLSGHVVINREGNYSSGDSTHSLPSGQSSIIIAPDGRHVAPEFDVYTEGSQINIICWAIDNMTICNWIDEVGVANLTRDHAIYVYYLSQGWTDLAGMKFGDFTMPEHPAIGQLQTLDNAVGAYYYSQGWSDLGNGKTGCNYTLGGLSRGSAAGRSTIPTY